MSLRRLGGRAVFPQADPIFSLNRAVPIFSLAAASRHFRPFELARRYDLVCGHCGGS